MAIARVEERLRRHRSVAAAANGNSVDDAWRKENEREGKFENAVHGDGVLLKEVRFCKVWRGMMWNLRYWFATGISASMIIKMNKIDYSDWDQELMQENK